MAPAIPDRWIPYIACGRVIEGTRIICFKVPLRERVQKRIPEIKKIWDINALIKKIPKLGAVIDLTNTYRYYDPKELQEAGILHKKILIPGRVIPPEASVTEFMDTVDEFLGKDCELIGVHCTHGLNRTGYMVCRYMRDRLGIPAKDAIKKFEKARGYQIERENYIADLLGKTPPPADIGKDTEIKPLHKKDKMSYISPLNDYKNDEEEYGKRKKYSNSWRSDSFNSERTNVKSRGKEKRDSESGSSFWTNRSGSQDKTNWRTEGRSTIKRKKNRSDSDKSFDYKYDY